MQKAITTTLLTMLVALTVLAQERYVVAFYNVENLFDTINSPTTVDEDMLPLSDKEWNSQKYTAKQTLLARAIADLATEQGMPTLLGLAEVENRSVVEDFISMPSLAETNYSICHYDSPDERGIDVALLYRADRFHYEGSRAIKAQTIGSTRDILTVWGEMAGVPTFVVVLHLPSRIGGVKFTEPQRRDCLRQVREVVDSVQKAAPSTRIIVMGDMNDNPLDSSLRDDLRARHKPNYASDLYNPFVKIWHKGKGSSVYDGRWNMYDNIIVSANTSLLPIHGKAEAAVFTAPYLTKRRSHPRPTFSGVEYEAGASDHLPIYIIIAE